MRPFLRRAAALLFFVLLMPLPAQAADLPPTALTEEEKTEKRLLFNQFVEMQLAQARQKKYAASQSQPQALRRTFISRVSSSYGYDSNVNLDSSRRGDGYALFSGEGAVEAEIGGFKFLPPRKIGMSWYSELMTYDSFEGSDYQSSTLSLYTEEKFHPQLTLKGQYDLSYVRYYNNNQLSYFGHRVKPTLTHYANQHFSHHLFGSYELRQFTQRLSLSDSANTLPLRREDDYYELGWGARYYPDERTFAGSTLALKWNDSNDIFHDYSDYAGWKINGFVYRKLSDKTSVVGFAGYDYKDYEGRILAGGSSQKDDFFYVGGYFYYDITKQWQGFVSYLYKQNDSTDPAVEYTGYTTSAGLTRTF